MKSFWKICAALLFGLSAVNAQTTPCDRQGGHSYCEVRELTLAFAGALNVETKVGAISVQGWDKDYVLLRASVCGNDEDEVRARAIASMVQIEVSAVRVWASGPAGESWGVSYEIWLPHASGVNVETRVGAISIADVTGAISAQTSVGAIALARLAGEVDAKTSVGAVAIELDGGRWEGRGLSVSTSTGAIRIAAPAEYSARFDLRTNLGAIVTSFPGARVAPAGLLGRRLVFDAGAGGAPIRAATSVGQIELSVTRPGSDSATPPR